MDLGGAKVRSIPRLDTDRESRTGMRGDISAALAGAGGTATLTYPNSLSLSAHFITHRLTLLIFVAQQSSDDCSAIAAMADIPGATQGCVANAAWAKSSMPTSTQQTGRRI